jgi:hypothetical protein
VATGRRHQLAANEISAHFVIQEIREKMRWIALWCNSAETLA